MQSGTPNALVTGGSGYFGSLLVRRLLQKGYRCRVLDLNDASDRPAEVEFLRGDIRNPSIVAAACQGTDVVHHNVAQVPLAKDRRLFDSVNIEGTRNLLQAALDARCRKVVYTSSSAVYGVPPSNPVTEETPRNPGEAYGQAKLEGEKLCRSFLERGLDCSVIRPRTIMGHGRLGIFQILFEWIREGHNVPVLGKGNNHYQFVHADDLADACIRAGEKAGPNAYNCGATDFGTMRETLEHLIRHAKSSSRVRSVPMGPAVLGMKITSAMRLSPLGAYHALMYGRSMYFDTTRAEKELGWTPRYSNAQMFEESYDWYLAHREQVLAANEGSHHRRGVRQGILGLVKWVL